MVSLLTGAYRGEGVYRDVVGGGSGLWWWMEAEGVSVEIQSR